MNHYVELNNYLKQLFDNGSYINTVTKGNISELDINKMDISPIAHIMVNDPDFGNGQTITFDVELTVLDIVDITNKVNEDKFWSNDNEVDVLGNTLQELNRVYLILLRDFEEKGYTAIQNAKATEVQANKDNMIGWTLPIQVIMPNDVISLCQ